MANYAWLQYNGTELVNVARTVALSRSLGVDIVRIRAESVSWIQAALEGDEGFGFGYGGFGFGGFGVGGTSDYGDITAAPWYDAGFPASAEFAGIIPLDIAGLGDSSLVASTTEYTGNGGNSNAPRYATQPLVADMVLVGSTARGVDYGKRWMDRTLKAGGTRLFCSGSDLVYFRTVPQDPSDAEKVLRRDVSLTRASTVTRVRTKKCSAEMRVTFTWTANDPFEYGEEKPQFTLLGGAVTGPGVDTHGTLDLTQESCPVYSYQPLYDPLYPALVAPPTAPDFYPDGWNIADGMAFRRYWARLDPVEPSSLNVIPIFQLTTSTEARRVRVSVWPSEAETDEQCDPLFSVVVNYLPTDLQFLVDAEQEASYVWDGASPLVRRADSLVFSPDAGPVEWSAFNDPDGLLVTLDTFSLGGGTFEGLGTIRVALALVPKSD